MATINRIHMFNINIDNVSLTEASRRILEMAKNKKHSSYVVTPNVDHVIKLQQDIEFKEIYDKAGLVLADGQPLLWAAKFLGIPLKEKVSGSDLFPVVCEMAAKEGLKVFFLGGREGVALAAAERLRGKFPDLNVVGVYSPPFGFDKQKEENDKIIEMLMLTKPDILFVGLGAPKQEKWIYRHLSAMGIPVSLGIGASFDFEAGTIKRAPIWMQKSGLEWFWRFCQEPKRLFKRYFIEDAKFFYLLMAEKRKIKKAMRLDNFKIYSRQKALSKK